MSASENKFFLLFFFRQTSKLRQCALRIMMTSEKLSLSRRAATDTRSERFFLIHLRSFLVFFFSNSFYLIARAVFIAELR
jgi:hypothetical protein